MAPVTKINLNDTSLNNVLIYIMGLNRMKSNKFVKYKYIHIPKYLIIKLKPNYILTCEVVSVQIYVRIVKNM